MCQPTNSVFWLKEIFTDEYKDLSKVAGTYKVVFIMFYSYARMLYSDLKWCYSKIFFKRWRWGKSMLQGNTYSSISILKQITVV